MRGGGGGAGPAFGPAPFLLGGVGAAKGLLPCFLVPKRNQPTACTLALWWLKFGPTEWGGGGAWLVFSGSSREPPRGGGVRKMGSNDPHPPPQTFSPPTPAHTSPYGEGGPSPCQPYNFSAGKCVVLQDNVL